MNDVYTLHDGRQIRILSNRHYQLLTPLGEPVGYGTNEVVEYAPTLADQYKASK